MKDTTRRIIAAVAAFSCLAAMSFTGCSDKNKSSKKNDAAQTGTTKSVMDMMKDFEFVTNENGHPVAAPFQSGDSSGNSISTNGTADLNAPDPTAPSGDGSGDSYETVTDANGETVTEMVAVTDANGASMTDANGQSMTQSVPKTQPAANNNGNAQNTTTADSQSSGEYVSDTQKAYIYWMDIEKNINYDFNGEFMKATFKIKDNIPDGDYPVSFTYDFSDKDAQKAIKPVSIYDGVIKVNSGAASVKDYSSETDFICYSKDIACKQGDTVEFYANIENNPGLVAMLNWVIYDANAMELISIEPAGEFESIAKRTTVGDPIAAN